MARSQQPPTGSSFSRHGAADRTSYADDALPLGAGLTDDFDDEEPQQFRRGSKRVPVRRGKLAGRTAERLRTGLVALLVLAALGAAIYQCRDYALHSPRFRLRRSEDIELAGDAPNSRAQVMEKMREAVGKNIFQISLGERKQELEKIPWVESATVIRLLPNRLRVLVQERTPVAFVALGGRVALIDANGVEMDLPPGVPSNYSFPVILGMSESEPLSTRAPRMQTYVRLMHELDGGEGQQPKLQYSRNVDEVDLSDPGDVKVTAKGSLGPVLLHLGNEDFLPRFMVFLSNVQKWEQDRGKLESVDLRYGREVILNPDPSAPVASAQPPAAATLKPAATALQPGAGNAVKAKAGRSNKRAAKRAAKTAAKKRWKASHPTETKHN